MVYISILLRFAYAKRIRWVYAEKFIYKYDYSKYTQLTKSPNVQFFYGFTTALIILLMGGAGIYFAQHEWGPEHLSGRTILGAMIALSPPSPTPLPPTATPTITPTPTIFESTIVFMHVPQTLTDEQQDSFTWKIDGPQKTAHTSTVYYGLVSSAGAFTTAMTPADTKYTQLLKDFSEGEYPVPLQFTAGLPVLSAGTYYYRAYTSIEEKNYWTNEGSFVVTVAPKNEIHLVSQPSEIAAGATASFTWDVTGPAATFPFTTIVVGKESKKGSLNFTVDSTQTPYKIVVNDFTNGSFTVPFRFIGNAKFDEPGTYYYRGLAFINGKNIWSEEYSLTVK